MSVIADGLAVLLGIGGIAFYLAGFFYPETHRRTDLIWSGLALLYALDLWLTADQLTPMVALGEAIGIVLIYALAWQTLVTRRQKTPQYQQTPVPLTPEVVSNFAKHTVNQLRIAPEPPIRPELQKRALTASTAERLRQNLDPRRRPIYDYEFVEDGLPELDAEEVVEDITFDEGRLTFEPVDFQLGLDLDEGEVDEGNDSLSEADVPVAEVILPSSVAAEVVTVVSTDVEEAVEAEAAVEVRETADVEEAADVEGVTDTEAATEVEAPAEAEAPEDFSATSDVTVSETMAAKEADSLDDIAADTDCDDDEWNTEKWASTIEPAETDSQAGSSMAAPRDKPSILATPFILAGWVKDMWMSMTKPKPSKPMIEIPQRQPSISNDSSAGDRSAGDISQNGVDSISDDNWVSTQASVNQATEPTFSKPSSYRAQPPVTSDSNWPDEPETGSVVKSSTSSEDDWEESNWDD